MSYTPHTWATGDVITAARLNAMEQGIAGAGGYDLVIKVDDWNVTETTDADLHLVEGSYASAIAKVIAGEPITAYVYAIVAEDPEYYFASMPIGSVYADTGYHDAIEIDLLPRNFLTGSLRASVRNSVGTAATTIYNAISSAPRTIYITESGISFTAPWA